MTTKKVSLEGRKRISELGTPDAVEAKKAELKAMQSAHQGELFETPKPVAEQPAVVPKTSTVRPELGVSQAVEKLLALYQKLSQPKDRNNYYCSPQERSKQMVNGLRELLQQKAGAGVLKRLSDAENLRQCQAFVDDICSHLGRQGIRMNRLQVVPADKRQK